MDATDLLRQELLEERIVAVTDEAIGAPLRALGAATHLLAAGPPIDEDALAAAAAGLESVDALVADGAELFSAAGGGLPGLRAAADGCFAAARAVANASFIAAGRGKVVLLAPPDLPTAAALENTARTLSIEWARFGITTACIHAGPATAALTAFLCSRAGDYYSGCTFAQADRDGLPSALA